MLENKIQILNSIIKEFCLNHALPDFEPLWSPLPFTGKWGIATSFFQLAALEARSGKLLASQRKSIPERAQELSEAIAAEISRAIFSKESQFSTDLSIFAHVEASKGYLNLYFSDSAFTKQTVDEILILGKKYGSGKPKKERVMVEYAQPNTHHSFHIGHARNAILGESLARIMEFSGYETLRASYPGDVGLGVITVVWAYQKFYLGKEPEGIHERGQWLLKIYIEATQLLEEKPNETPQAKKLREQYEAERREIYRKWDQGDPEIRAIWQKTRQWSLDELNEILKILDIHMDVWFYESEVDELAKSIVEELVARGIAEDERPQGGAVIVRIDEKLGLTKEKYRSNVILRSDGTTLYLTKDLALAKVKFDQYGVDRSIYVIDVRQSLHMQQAFKILELMGYKQAEKCYHLGYGFVSLPEGTISSRHGRVVLFKDVVDEAVRRVLAVIAEKNPDLPETQRQKVAYQVGLGALIYSILSVDNNKDTIFDIEQALNFDGHTAPYIQNAYVRANSILRKSGESLPTHSDFSYALTNYEIQLVDLLSRFPQIVSQAEKEYRPLVVASYAYDLASAFHSFYHFVPVLQAESTRTRQDRLRLVAATRQVLENALFLLDIQAPEVM